MKSAQKTKLKKLIVAVASSEARTIGEPRMYRMPAFKCPRSAFSVGGSTGEIDLRASAEATKETASTTSAPGADRAWTSSPPTLGPPTYESARLPLSTEFASRY